MARGDRLCQITISDSEPDDPRTRGSGQCSEPSPSVLTRSSLGTVQAESLRINQTPSQTPTNPDAGVPGVCQRPSSSAKPLHDETDTPLALVRSPSQQTPKKGEVSVAKLASSLRDFSQEIGVNHAKLTARLIHDAWKRDTPEPQLISKKDWFAGMKLEPVNPTGKSSESMRIKTKQVGQGRTGKQEKRERYPVICIKTNQEPTPRYSFHHVEIKKNILSPNTMLTYVPHLRDLADNEENTYRRWLENLEAMDKTSGFDTLSRHEKVVKTIRKERATTLLEYLDIWLARLGIENCTKAALMRHVASQSDVVTPQQKSSLLNLYNDNSDSPRTAKNVRIFMEAFDLVFDARDLGDHAVPLRNVLLLDKSADAILDSKKYMRDTPSQSKTAEDPQSVESFLETYSLLGCLVCASHSCEHGEYGVDNERKRYSVEVVGGFAPTIRQQLTQRLHAAKADATSYRVETPCGEECYLRGRPSSRSRPWHDAEIMLLKSFHLCFYGTSIPVQCSTAVATGRPCWDVQRQMDRLDLVPPDIPMPMQFDVKPLPWYDRHRKMLIGDWQEQTRTHEHQRRDHFDPCYHDGPCDKNCPCVQNHVMCERFCRCTAETCANKFTGCACHSLGKTCMSKQKDRPCICILLNRECDPGLCGTCGATERAMPKNAHDDALYATGCQNCALQRGKSKAVIIGKSKVSGYGLFATEDIAQDEFVIEYVGELISQDEGVRREARRGDVFDESSNSSYLFTLLEQEGIWVDAAIYGNLSRYINHQDTNCNVTPKIVYVNGEYRIKFTSLRDIKAGEELFFNYGENFPNLTKKLLEGGKTEKKKRKSKDQAAASEDGEKVKKKPGRKPGKKPGRKPGPKPKKASALLEPDRDNEEVNEDPMDDPFVDIDPPLPRKRKRRVADDSDSSEYQPNVADPPARHSGNASAIPSQPPAVPGEKPKRMRLPNGTFVSYSYAEKMMSQGTKVEDDGSERAAKKLRTIPDKPAANKDPSVPVANPPKARVGRPRKQQYSAAVFEENTPTIQESGNSAAYSHTEARLELDEGDPQVDKTPTRRRTRLSHRGVESSPISMQDDSGSHAIEVDLADLSGSDLLQSGKKRRGRKGKTGDDEYNGSSWTDSDGIRHVGDPDYTDDDSVPVDRHRRRRRPARYDD